MFEKYTARLCAEIGHARETAREMGGLIDRATDTIYFGGGTPTLLTVEQLGRVFVTIRQHFGLQANAEITVESAPGTLSVAMIDCLVRNGVNRVSLGVQSFVDQEARSVARLHNRETVLNDIAHLREAGIANINIDLIAGLPHQTWESWKESLNALIATGVPHASVYMLEVDEESRLGRELIAGGQKYHAHFAPDEDLTAGMYELACERLNSAGIAQYEISNFACPGFESKHNLKYWTRLPYLGFGVDAHSMLFTKDEPEAIRFANADGIEKYFAVESAQPSVISNDSALQEAFFLGLRLNRGVHLGILRRRFGNAALASYEDRIAELVSSELLARTNELIQLTNRGRLISNEVFQRFISVPAL